MVSVPVVQIPRVYHVGTLDPARRGELHRTSQEGPCLSVSLCPTAWSEIARIGGDLHALERKGAAYLDVTALLHDEEAAAVVLGWAEAEGLIERRTMWRAWQFDDESEEWRYFVCSSRKEAEGETEWVDEGPGGGDPVEEFEAWMPTPLLGQRLGCEAASPAFASDFAVMAWARDAAPDLLGFRLDGVWFAENFDSGNASAPRGGIFPDAVGDFARARVEWGVVCVEAELASMPEPVPHRLLIAPESVPSPEVSHLPSP